MPQPTLQAFGERLYDLVEPLALGQDEANGWGLCKLIVAVAHPFEAVYAVVYDTDDRPGYAVLLDVDDCPTWALPWLAQFRGVTLVPQLVGESDADYWLAMRARIAGADGQNRGSNEAMIVSAQRFLTGTKTVIVTERPGDDAYALLIRTVTSETPDPARVLAAILEQKPAGLTLDYDTEILTWSFDLLAAAFPTFDAAEAFYADFDDMAVRSPV